jgi:hypothetical protein
MPNLFEIAARQYRNNDERPIFASRLPTIYERDTAKARDIAREQAQLGRLAVWRPIVQYEPYGDVVAIVYSQSELLAMAAAQQKAVADFIPGQTREIPIEDLFTHPTSSVSARDLWALNEAIRKADALDQQASGE